MSQVVSLETTRSALAHIPAHDRDLWVRMAFAVKSEHGEEGFSAWDEWSRGAENYQEKPAREVWKSAKPGSVGIGTLLHEAKQRGFALNGERSKIDPAEIDRHKEARAELERQAEAKRQSDQAKAVTWARDTWKAATPAREDHPYLQRKAAAPTDTMREIAQARITSILGYAPRQHDALLTGRLLVLPVKIGDQLSTLELIDEQGRKTALYGGAKSGGYWAADALPEAGYKETLLIGEGAATVLSARAATGFPVVAALSAGNLAPVAKAMRAKYPNARLVILGDLGNGEAKARAAEAEAGAALALPDFGPDRKPEQTDFNDLARVRGLEAVKAQVEAALSVKQEAKPGPIIYQRISEIEAKPINWLWRGRIARGKVSMIAGHPGLGKSQITASLAAIVTTGGRWPVDRTPCERGSVLFLSAEDDPADTIRPRLEAAGADLERVHILQAVRDGFNAEGDEIQRAFNLKADIRRLEAVLQEIGDVALVVIDPVSAYLGGADSHNNAEVRALLAPLSDMAARAGAAVVAVSHLNKGGGGSGDALARVTGSLAFVAAARAAYIVAKDPVDEARRLFLPAKNNIGADIGGLAFGIESCVIGAGIDTSRIAWESVAVTGMSADEVMRAPTDPEEQSGSAEAADLLRELLSSGPMGAREATGKLAGSGYTNKQIRRAREKLGVVSVKQGFGSEACHVWKLPQTCPDTSNLPKDAHSRDGASRASMGMVDVPPAPETEKF